MAKTTVCDYEGTGPAGTTLTNANTGGVVAIGASCTAVSVAPGAYGSFAGSFAVPATNVSSRVTSSAVTGTQFALSFKFRIPTGFATTKRIMIPQTSAFANIMSFNYNGSTNRLQIQNQAGAGTLTHAAALSLNTWYRVETVMTVATTGSIRVNIYDNEGTTPLAATTTSAAFDLGNAGMFQIVHGITANGTTVAGTVDIDSVRFDNGGVFELGPEALTSLTSDLDSRWLVLNQVLTDLDARWGVRSTTVSDLDARWGVRATLSSDLDARWRVFNRLTSDLDARWRVRNIATSDLDTRWRVLNRLTSDLDARWRVFSRVTSDLDNRWRVLNQVLTDLDSRWRVCSLLTSDLDARWRVRNQVSATLSALWRVYSPPRDVQVAATLAEQERIVSDLAEPGRIAATLGAQDG